MFDDKRTESNKIAIELNKENRSLKRQLRSLEATLERNKAMLAARTTVSNVLEAEQKKMERNMNLLLEHSADIILMFDKDGCFSYFTRTFEQASGIADPCLISGRHFTEVFARFISEERVGFLKNNYELAMSKRATVVVNSSIDLSGKGEPKDYDIQITPMMDSDGNLEAAMMLLHDMTDIIRSKRQAESASTAKSQFLATMSHEMRTPLNAVIGMASIGKIAEDRERMQYCFTKIEDASAHLLGVINDILDMSKIEAKKFELSSIEFNFEKSIQKAVNVVNFRIDEKKQKLTVSIDESIPNVLVGDAQRFVQVITNLLGNAVKFTHDEGEIWIETRLLGEEGGVCIIQISVSDTGIGISPEQQTYLFESFQQAESDTARNFGGTGLGLSISKSIVEMMGGSIHVRSELGKGSTFSFTVRLARGKGAGQSQSDSTRATETAIPTAVFPGSEPKRLDISASENIGIFAGRSILLAEDVEINREIVIALLSPTGINIDCAENGAEAVSMFSAAPDKYDLIFMDLHMPGTDGYEATRRIRDLKIPEAGAVPIVAMTANVFKEDIERCLESGMNGHIGKPLDFDEVLMHLRSHLLPS